MDGPEKTVYRFGPFQADAAKRLLVRDGEPVAITSKVFDTLLLLIRHRGQVLAKEVLLSGIWPDTVVEEKNLTVNISALRKALGENPQDHRYIVTAPGRGYSFVADVEVGEVGKVGKVGSDTAPAGLPPLLVQEQVTRSVTIEQEKYTNRRGVWIAAAVVVFLGIASAAWWRETRQAPRVPIRSIAVLPFRNLSGDQDREYFSDGTTEALISNLSSIHALKVISPTTMLRYKGTARTTREIAGELGVESILEGSVQRSGQRVRVNVQLIHAASDTNLWAGTYDRDLSDVLMLESDIAQAIAQEIRIQLTPEERTRLARVRRINAEAQDDFLMGRFYHLKLSPSYYPKAVDYLERAIRLQPDYAAPYAELSTTLQDLGGPEKRQDYLQMAQKAVGLDPDLAEAHAALGGAKMLNWEWTGSEAEFRRSIALDPASLDACGCYAVLLMYLGRFDEALVNIEHAAGLNPMSAWVQQIYGSILYVRGRYEEAILRLRRALELEPENGIARMNLIEAYALLGKTREALAAAEVPEPRPSATLAWAYAVAGRRGDAQAMLRTIPEPDPYTSAIAWFQAGDRDRGFELLTKVFDSKDLFSAYSRVDPIWDPVRTDARFQKLVARLGLPDRPAQRN
jgi:TolB-like protein/DNA-binding winged helix-turn-helix (wHTH) protein